jgi:antitoxin component YwqK of YwqJK toxin-antitoxin module
MMKKINFILLLIFSCLNILFVNCNGNHESEAQQLKQDSIQKAQLKQKQNPYSKYLITPPDSDYTGDYIDKYPNGIIKFNGFFRFGQRHGQWMAFYENGLKWSECFYDKGKKHGSTMVYHPNGKLFYSGWYKNDLKDSLWLYYDTTGKEIDRRAFRNDIETGLVN